MDSQPVTVLSETYSISLSESLEKDFTLDEDMEGDVTDGASGLGTVSLMKDRDKNISDEERIDDCFWMNTPLSDGISGMKYEKQMDLPSLIEYFGLRTPLTKSYATYAQKRRNKRLYLPVPSKLKCTKCYFRTQSHFTLKLHIEQNHSDKTRFLCMTCNHTSDDEASMREHIETSIMLESLQFLKNDNSANVNVAEDLSCKKKDRNRANYKKRQLHNGGYICIEGKSQQNDNIGSKEASCNSSDEAIFISPLDKKKCVDQFKNVLGVVDKLDVSYAALAPKRNATGNVKDSKIKCSKCYYRANSHDNLRAHMDEIHSRENHLNCPACDYTASDEVLLNCHMEGHPDVKRYKCPLCEFLTTSRNNFEVHTIKCHLKRYYFCKACDFGTFDPVEFGSHKIIHPPPPTPRTVYKNVRRTDDRDIKLNYEKTYLILKDGNNNCNYPSSDENFDYNSVDTSNNNIKKDFPLKKSVKKDIKIISSNKNIFKNAFSFKIKTFPSKRVSQSGKKFVDTANLNSDNKKTEVSNLSSIAGQNSVSNCSDGSDFNSHGVASNGSDSEFLGNDECNGRILSENFSSPIRYGQDKSFFENYNPFDLCGDSSGNDSSNKGGSDGFPTNDLDGNNEATDPIGILDSEIVKSSDAMFENDAKMIDRLVEVMYERDMLDSRVDNDRLRFTDNDNVLSKIMDTMECIGEDGAIGDGQNDCGDFLTDFMEAIDEQESSVNFNGAKNDRIDSDVICSLNLIDMINHDDNYLNKLTGIDCSGDDFLNADSNYETDLFDCDGSDGIFDDRNYNDKNDCFLNLTAAAHDKHDLSDLNFDGDDFSKRPDVFKKGGYSDAFLNESVFRSKSNDNSLKDLLLDVCSDVVDSLSRCIDPSDGTDSIALSTT